jgi:aspartyl-tRNA(Asn)/glutamyl-tRNA(Gln) amidotransferase subunit C
MKIDHTTVDKLADLAKLEFDADAKDEILNDLNRILTFIEKLNSLDTTNIEPLIYMSDEVSVLRADQVRHDITQTDALRNAPQHDSDYFRIPKVMSK